MIVGLGIRVSLSLAIPVARAAEYHLTECSSEISHGEGVYDGIHPRVQVSKPSEYREYDIRSVHALDMAYTVENVSTEERHPANNEHTHDDAQRFGRLLLSGQLSNLLAYCEMSDLFGDESRWSLWVVAVVYVMSC